MSDSVRHAVVVSGPAAFVLARLFERVEVERRLDAAGFRGSPRGEGVREEVLSAVERFAEQGNAWHAAQRGDESVRSIALLPRSADARGSEAMTEQAMMTTEEAAEALGIGAVRVRQLVYAGKLDAKQERNGRPWAISATSVEARRAEGRAGR